MAGGFVGPVGPGIGMRVDVDTRGPVFQPGLPKSVLNKALRDGVEEVAREGEKLVKMQLYPGHGYESGHYKRSVHGHVRGTVAEVHDSGVIYGAWLEGVSRRNQRTRFKGYRMFRNAMRRLAPAAERIAAGPVRRAVERLN